MAHEIIEGLDKVGVFGKQAWHGLGVLIEDNLSAVEAGRRFLDWPVEGWRLTAHGPAGETVDVSTHMATVRTQDNDKNRISRVLGVVGKDYQICQNQELAEFCDALGETGKVKVETIGSIRGGARVWYLLRSNEFSIGGNENLVWPYLLASNGHDGMSRLRLTPTTTWVVCSNTLHMVIPNSEDRLQRPEEAAISIRHSGSLSDKLEEAKRALKYYDRIRARNIELYEYMNSKKVTRDQAVEFFANGYSAFWTAATPEELGSGDTKVRRTAELRMERMKSAAQAFLHRLNEEEEKFKGRSVLSMFNAMSGFVQHDKRPRGVDDIARVDRRRESNLFGINADRTRELFASAMALAV